MQQFVRLGVPRFFGVPLKAEANLPLVKPLALPVDDKALQRAQAIYAGHHHLTDAEFAGLQWLQHFSSCGRHLLVGHALGLIDRWLRLKRRTGPLAEEVVLLRQLLQATGSFASYLSPEVIEPARRALRDQLERVSRLQPRSAVEALAKATTLLDVGRRLQQGARATREGLVLLERALPELIAADGSPLAHGPKDYADWVSPLLADEETTFPDRVRHGLDRALPYLSMLVEADHHFVFNTTTKPLTRILTTPPLRLAPQARVARLVGDKLVVLALPDWPDSWPFLSISSQNGKIACAGYFESDDRDDSFVTDVATQQNDHGQLAQVRLPTAERTIFLSSHAEDLRVEDRLMCTKGATRMTLAFNSDTKLMVSRQGLSAAIVMDRRNVWQLSLRGAVILPSQQTSQLVIEATASTVNWALRRTERKVARSVCTQQTELFI